MKLLGKINESEQYYPVDSHIFLSDSNDAFDFFEADTIQKDGAVCLINARINSLKYPFMLFWAYVSVKHKKILDLAPVFCLDDPTVLLQANILKMEMLEGSTYFFWNGNIHASLWTEDKEIAVRQVRSVLYANIAKNLIQLGSGNYCDEVVPVKVFQRSTGRFLAIFWLCSLDDNTSGVQLVCEEDTPAGWGNEMLHDSFYHFIDVGETVIIDHAFHELKYDPKFGEHFVRLPFIATEADYRKEDIPEKLFKQQLRIIPPSSSEIIKNGSTAKAKVVSFPKKGKI